MASRNVTFQLDRPASAKWRNNFSFHPQQQQQQQQQPFDPYHSPSKPTPSQIGKSPLPEKEQAWRKHGKAYRAQIVLQDEQKGGNSFVLSNECSIDRYYRVAEKVLDQFLSTSSASSNPEEVSEAYLVGNRLVKFLSVVLPTHKEYYSNDPAFLVLCRGRSQEQLIDLLQYMEELALIVDQIQYNSYILQDLKPAKKSNSGDWTESTANDTSLESMTSETGPHHHLEQRIAAVVAASETDASSTHAKPSLHKSYPSKPQKFQDMSFEDDLFDDTDEFEDDFDIRSADFSFQADFSNFDNNDDYWFSKTQNSRNEADWFSENQHASFTTHNTSFTTPTSNRHSNTTRTPRSAPARSNGLNTTPTRIPKMKPPRSAPPRDLMQQSFPVEFDIPSSSATSSPNRKSSLLDDDTLPAPKSKIEERLERAELLQNDFRHMELVNRRQPREDTLTTMNSNKRLLQHFKGCVRCLVE